MKVLDKSSKGRGTADGLAAGSEPSTAMAIFFCMRHPFTYINN
jgi:hypothetical protein